MKALRDLVVLIAGLFQVFVGDRYCTDCGMRTNQVTNAQYDSWLATGWLPCRCGAGVLQTLTEIKTAAALDAPAAAASTDTHPHLH